MILSIIKLWSIFIYLFCCYDFAVALMKIVVYSWTSSCVWQICAVLAAVTEVIRAQGGKETETEYFAALVGQFYDNQVFIF